MDSYVFMIDIKPSQEHFKHEKDKTSKHIKGQSYE